MVVQDDLAEPDALTVEAVPDKEESARVLAQVTQKLGLVRSDKEFHDKAFKQMRKDMFMAFHGRDESYAETNYKTNIAGRHVKQKTAALYAKNPEATAARNDRLDFELWDENPKSLMMAFEITQAAQLALQQAAMSAQIDPITGMAVPVDPILPPGFEQARAIIADFQKGTAYRTLVEKVGRTLEILFAKSLRDQRPLNFKMAAKALVRRACTCGVGYIELGFVRQYGPRPDLDAQLSDSRVRLDHLRRLTEEALAGDIDEDDAEMAELEASLAALQTEPEIVLNEGLSFDFPQSTKVIPDQLTTQLVGFVGARHLTIEYLFTIDQVKEFFPDFDVEKSGFRGYGSDGKSIEGPAQAEIPFDDDMDDEDEYKKDGNGKGLVCVWKHYDKLSGLVYYLADGAKQFLREPAPPDVFVEDFWPLYALTFNAVESEKHLFPKSDVALLADSAMEHNRSRQGMREHRSAARPRWATSKGLLDEAGRDALANAKPFDVIEVNKDPATKIDQVLEPIPVEGVDMNLYATEAFEQDRQMAVGTSDASYGAVSRATATESAIAANSTLSSDDSSKDDLDDFPSVIARAASQILFAEMSEEQVKKIVGPGAVWPQQTIAEIANEMFLEVEAGSSGRPNQAVEIENFTKLAPIIMQIPGVDMVEFGKEAIRRLGDKLDVNKFIMAGAPSIVAQNQMAQPATGDPTTDPSLQGGEGGANAPTQPEQESPGGPVPMGGNQTERPAA
jgi:hypothetical protein